MSIETAIDELHVELAGNGRRESRMTQHFQNKENAQ
jgi:hypothetical protein